jgi:hypothetical protein
MKPDTLFLIAITVSYVAACIVMLLLTKYKPAWWAKEVTIEEDTNKKHLDFVLSLVAAVSILAIGQLYRHHYLLPETRVKGHFSVAWCINNLIIFSPIFIFLIIRRQPLSSIYLSFKEPGKKILWGIILSVFSCSIYLLLIGRMNEYGNFFLNDLFLPHYLENFPAVFLEGVAVIYFLTRVKNISSPFIAILITTLLFSASHVPSAIKQGDTFLIISIFFIFNTILPSFILYSVVKTRDVIWIGIVHYCMDVAIGTFK